jgi:uncharacterized damage-inducible protein DinB
VISAEYCQVLAQYNAWINAKLYDLCCTIDDAQRRRDRGAFFGSVHNTLNHIMYGDLAFMSRLTGDPAIVPELRC